MAPRPSMSTVLILLPLTGLISCLLLVVAAVSTVLRDAAPSIRLAATVCLLYGVFAWGFQILGLAGVFSLPVVVATYVLVPVAMVCWRRADIAVAMRALCVDVRREMAALATALKSQRLLLTVIAVIGIHVLVRLARALAMPRLGWDDFTYHLFRASRWVQNGGIVLEPAPDAWRYYEFFPWGGDLIWAWALIWRAGDVFVAAAAVAIWLTCLLLAYGLARRWNHEPVPSLLAAIALVVLPSQLALIATAYVDNVQLMLVLACALLLCEILQVGHDSSKSVASRTRSAAALLGLGCGLGTLVKLSFLPLFGAAAAVVAWDGVRRRRIWSLLAFALGAAIVVPNFVFNWYHRGSPFYPFHVLDPLPFNAQLAQVLSRLQPADAWHRVSSALRALVLNVQPQDPFLNIGFAGALMLPIGIVGAASLWTRTATARPYLVWAAGAAVVTISELLAPSNGSMLTAWAVVLGRSVVPILAVILLLAARVPWALRFIVLPILTAEYFWYAPWQWPREVVLATGVVLATLLGVGVAAAVALRFRSWVRWPVLGVAVVASFSFIAAMHDRLRYEVYRSFASGQLDDFHGAPMGDWPIWLRLEEAGPTRVAIAAGWDGIGHNWFRYGLLGSRLQNDVRYVPITTDGSVVDYADHERMAALADREAWLGRLLDQRIRWVVLQGPRALEHQWVEELPDVFSIELALGDRTWILARVNDGNLSRRVRSTR